MLLRPSVLIVSFSTLEPGPTSIVDASMLLALWSVFRREKNMNEAGFAVPLFLARLKERAVLVPVGSQPLPLLADAARAPAFHLYLAVMHRALRHVPADALRRDFFSRILVHLPATPRAITEEARADVCLWESSLEHPR